MTTHITARTFIGAFETAALIIGETINTLKVDRECSIAADCRVYNGKGGWISDLGNSKLKVTTTAGHTIEISIAH